MAYGIGLITTDGSLSPDMRHIIFVSKDLELIENFKKCFALDNKISSKKGGYSKEGKYFVIQFGNVKLYDWLLEIGLMSNKTKKIAELDIPDLYLPDFLRGHLDGDGNIRVYQDPIYPRSQRLYTRFVSASHPHLIWLQNRIRSLLKLKGFIRRNTNTYELNYAKGESKILLPAIYHDKNVFCLQRKRKIVEQFL